MTLSNQCVAVRVWPHLHASSYVRPANNRAVSSMPI